MPPSWIKRKRNVKSPLALLLVIVSLSGCGIIYKPDVQQGNLLEQKNVTELKPGMTKRQVLALLGSPSVQNPFTRDRWDYVASYQHRGGAVDVRRFTVFFKNDALVRTEGNFFAENSKDLLKQSDAYKGEYIPTIPKKNGQGDGGG